MDRKMLETKIFNTISNHGPIKKAALLRHFSANEDVSLDERHLRKIIEEMISKSEILICSTVDKGYYIPKTYDEAEESLREDNARAMKVLTKRGIKKRLMRRKFKETYISPEFNLA